MGFTEGRNFFGTLLVHRFLVPITPPPPLSRHFLSVYLRCLFACHNKPPDGIVVDTELSRTLKECPCAVVESPVRPAEWVPTYGRPRPPRGNVSAPGARRASFVTRALPVDCCR